ncbi:hypothetical protein TNCV_3169561 [Trichonephila clavipes]|nr:hypothetical protein TNCV_3169561 [Trichonephila clavipes]
MKEKDLATTERRNRSERERREGGKEKPGLPTNDYARLRSAMHVLETLQEVFFWDGVQKPRPILGISSILISRFSHP